MNNLPQQQLNGFTAVGASPTIPIGDGVLTQVIETWFEDYGVTAVSALTVEVQGSFTDADGVTRIVTSTGPSLAKGSTAEKFANGAFIFKIQNNNYSKAAVAAGSLFTSAHVVTASKFAVINIYIGILGTFLTLVRDSDSSQTDTIGYDTAVAALNAADAISTPGGYCYVGRILIQNNGSTWTANTDDLTNASDVTTATFIDASSTYFPVGTIVFGSSALSQMRNISALNVYVPYIQLFLKTLTGNGRVYSRLIQVKQAVEI